jgi:hypothetical protein
MLIDITSETVNIIIGFLFGISIVGGYYIYSLVSKWLDHWTHTQKIDLWAKHFADNKHMLCDVGASVNDLVTGAENHLFTYSVGTLASDFVGGIVQATVPNVLKHINDQNNRTELINLVWPLANSICNYFSKSKKSHNKNGFNNMLKHRPNLDMEEMCMRIPCKAYVPIPVNNQPIGVSGVTGVTGPTGAIPTVSTDETISPTLTDNFSYMIKLLSVYRSLITPEQKQKFRRQYQLFVTDLKNELGNKPEVNNIIDQLMEKLLSVCFSPDDATTLQQFNELYVFYESNNEILIDTIREYVADPSKNHPFKDLLITSIDMAKTGDMDMVKCIMAVQNLVAKYNIDV